MFLQKLKKKSELKLYSSGVPIWWILLSFPISWLFVISANYVINTIVLLFGLIIFGVREKLTFYKKNIILVFVFGLLSNLVGMLLILATQFGEEKGAWYEYLSAPLANNPFDNVYSMLYTFFAVAASGCLIYVLNRYVSFRKVKNVKLKRSLSIVLAILTAPYLLFIPSTALTSEDTECFTNHIVWIEHVRAEVFLSDDPSIDIMSLEGGRPNSYELVNVLKDGVNTADDSGKKLKDEWDFKACFYKGGSSSERDVELYFYRIDNKLYFVYENEKYVVSNKYSGDILREVEEQAAFSV